MRYRLIALAVLLPFGIVSCGGDSTPSSTTEAPAVAPAPPPTAPQPSPAPLNLAPRTAVATAAPVRPAAAAPRPAAAAPRPAPARAAPAQVVPPTDAKWTLFCFEYGGQGHIEASRALKDSLIKRTGRNDWHIVHGLESSKLYLGYYRAIDQKDTRNIADVKRAWADRTMVSGLPDDQGIRYFEHCGFVPIEAPDPAAPPEWNLANVDRDLAPRDPQRRFWSLQIMAFKDNEKRKEAAVDAVRTLRQNGVEAYYYHGDTVSSVCVGAWPRLAVKEQQDDGTRNVGGPNTTLLVSADPVPDEYKPKARDDRGNPVIAVTPKLEIVDKSLQTMVAQYKYHAVNYDIRLNRTRDGRQVEDPSFLVVIPRARGNGYYDSAEQAAPIAGARSGNDAGNGFAPDGGDTRIIRRGGINGALEGQAPGSAQPPRPGGR